MPIHEPGRRLMHHVALKFVAKKVSGGGHRGTNASLSLTSMIDFLVVTVVFLLMTFSSSGETPVQKGVTLPTALSTENLLDAPIVGVANSLIILDGKPIANTRNIEQDNKLQRIEELYSALSATKRNWKIVNCGSENCPPNKEHPGIVTLQIDQNVPAVVVKSVFQTAAFAGFPNVSFMVNSGAKPK